MSSSCQGIWSKPATRPVSARTPESVGQVVVLRALGLGDFLVAVPALRGLRRAFPQHHLTLAAPRWLREAVEVSDSVDELVDVADLSAPVPSLREADVLVNAHGDGWQSWRWCQRIVADRYMGYAGDAVEQVDGPRPTAGVHQRQRWVDLLDWFGIPADAADFRLRPPRVPPPVPGASIVHIGAAYASRQWPVERFAEVAKTLAVAGHTLIITGNAAERERALAVARCAGLDEQVVYAGRLSLAEFMSTIAAAALLVSADTSAAHLASAYGRPSVVLFGPASIQEWGPPVGPHIALAAATVARGDPFAPTPDAALLSVDVFHVVRALERLGLL